MILVTYTCQSNFVQFSPGREPRRRGTIKDILNAYISISLLAWDLEREMAAA
jgi:hypothetical protein